MKKGQKHLIGLISYNLYSNHMNYGAALHSYAFQQYLKKQGVDSVIIDYVPLEFRYKSIKYPILNYRRFWHLRGFTVHFLTWLIGFFPNIRKYNAFQAFFKKHYVKTKHRYGHAEMLRMKELEGLPIDCWVCESDVIWKLYKTNGFNEVFFLNLPAAEGKRKVAYSPSLGSRPFTEAETDRFQCLVEDFAAISCRECEGAEYMSRLLDREVRWVLDPTLLLSSADYQKIAIQPKEQRYLLAYNCMVNDRDMLREAQRMADRLGLELIEISNFNLNKLSFKHTVKTDVGMEEFLGYFQDADFIVCNAFHGCCFSVIFQKQFFLFQRDSSDFRMKSLTDGLGISNRLIPHTHKEIPTDYSPIDYTVVNENLEALRLRSYEFIRQNIL